MPQRSTESGDANQPGRNRGQPQPDSLENDDRGTKPYQKQSQRQAQWQEHRENPEKGDPNVIGDPPPDDDDIVRADDNDPIERDDGVVEDSDPPLPTDDGGELGSSERH